jgi:hypothetical protein
VAMAVPVVWAGPVVLAALRAPVEPVAPRALRLTPVMVATAVMPAPVVTAVTARPV